jgi:hypothetical protein
MLSFRYNPLTQVSPLARLHSTVQTTLGERQSLNCLTRGNSLAGGICPVLLTGTFGCAIWRSAGRSS